jgi:flagellar biosynthesis/type III secretory pathway M-ring protein FliF/YscJ
VNVTADGLLTVTVAFTDVPVGRPAEVVLIGISNDIVSTRLGATVVVVVVVGVWLCVRTLAAEAGTRATEPAVATQATSAARQREGEGLRTEDIKESLSDNANFVDKHNRTSTYKTNPTRFGTLGTLTYMVGANALLAHVPRNSSASTISYA